jgi:hypothetical protein
MHSQSSIGWYKFLKSKSNLLILRLPSNDSEPLADSRYVGVHRHSGMAGHEGKHDIRRLVADTR